MTRIPAHHDSEVSRARSTPPMNLRCWLLLAMAILVGLVPVIASPSAVGAAQNPNKPIVLPVDLTFPARGLTARCGFDVTVHIVGTFTFKVLPNGIELDRLRFDSIFSGPGGSLTTNRVENDKYTATMSPDGTLVESITASGMIMPTWILPGHGAIAINTGHELLQFTWQYDEELGDYVLVDEQVFFDAGPVNTLTDAEFALVCAELA